jgi:hypothetical protein
MMMMMMMTKSGLLAVLCHPPSASMYKHPLFGRTPVVYFCMRFDVSKVTHALLMVLPALPVLAK